MTSNVDSTKPRTFNPEGVWAPPPTYNQVAVTPLLPSSRLITLAGMTGCDPTRSDNPHTVQEQAPIAYENIRKALAAAGATPRDIVQVSAPISLRPYSSHLSCRQALTNGLQPGQALHREGDWRCRSRSPGRSGSRLGGIVDGVHG